MNISSDRFNKYYFFLLINIFYENKTCNPIFRQHLKLYFGKKGHPPSKDTHLFATLEMGYPFIQSVLIQALKQLWDSNHYSSVAMTQLFMCDKNHFD